jgi:peptidoglycan/xylan/chitin deacetylase (PgdA/CDA1 family)
MARLLSKLARRIEHYRTPRALVLMYHRVAEPRLDSWELAVSPAHFEQQLRVLRQHGPVIGAEELAARLHSGTLPRRSTVITFDDGYLDNYLNAKPLLEKYRLPATFFIPSGHIGSTQAFWWDELATLLLATEQLPAHLALASAGVVLAASLGAEQQLTPALRAAHQRWKTSTEAPPTQRAALYYRLWQHLRPLPQPAQQQLLGQLRAWAGHPAGPPGGSTTMSASQLQALHAHGLFTIGAHTVTHPALASQPPDTQAQELATGKQALQQLLGTEVGLLAYPYGDYDATTAASAAQLGFRAAFTTAGQLVTARAAAHQLGRFQVNNWDGPTFRRYLAQWLST